MSLFVFTLIYPIFSYGLLLILPQICLGSHSSLRVVNGYKGVVIALSPEMTENSDLKDIQNLITDASKVLYEATNGAVFFEEVTILVPTSWTGITTDSDMPSVRYSDADIIITEKESVQSFTMQFAGCGEHALPIVLTKQFVGTGDQFGASAKQLVHQWAQYRYGVFNEFGFPGDPLYPAYYSIAGNANSNEILVNSCTDDQHVFNIDTREANGDRCDMTTSNSTGMPPPNDRCIPLPDIHNNTFKSSFMYSQSVINVTKFCGSDSAEHGVHKHNVNSPNKQNVLCDGRDAWNVIKTHPDIHSKRSTFSGTTFKTLRDSAPRILFAIENSEQMNTFQRNVWINLALNKISQIDLPGAETALYTFNKGTLTNVHDWKIGQQLFVNVEGTAQQIDFEAVLSKGRDLFSDKKGGIFVILFGGKGIISSNTEQGIAKVAEDLRDLNIKLNIIVFPMFESITDRTHASPLIKTALSITGGQVFHIREDKLTDTTTSMSTVNQILKAFRTVQTDFSGDYTKPYHLISDKVFTNLKETIEFKFTTDTTLMSRNFRVYLISPVSEYGGTVIIGKMTLKAPSGIENTKPDINDPAKFVKGFTGTIQSIGDWVLTAKLQKPKATDSLIAIAEFDTKSFGESVITAECWLNTDVEYSPKSDKPILVYVNINKGFDELIADASVHVIVTHETFQNSGNSGYNETIELLDDGLGDPDITAGDGIYSQYVVNLRNSGYYTISAVITDKSGKVLATKDFGSTSLPTVSKAKPCCGSKIVGQTSELDIHFTRMVECGSIFVANNYDIEDYPPNSVRDLRIESADYYNRTINLLWTSPGGDYTFSNVHKYDIKAFRGIDYDSDLRLKIKNQFDSTSGADIEIQTIKLADSYGKEQRSQIRVMSEEGGMHYLALRAYDSRGHASVVSNVVMAYIKMNGFGGASHKLAGLEWWEILLISIGGAIVLIFIIVVAICFAAKKRRKSDETERREPVPQRRAPEPPLRISPELEKNESILLDNNSLTHSVDKIPNIHVNGIHSNNSHNSGSQQNLRELSVNALVPIHSFDANLLLSHWGRVQEAKERHEAPPVMRIEDIESASSNHSPSYASSEDDNTAIYTNPNNWRYQDVNARPTYIPNGYNEPIYRSSLDPMRSTTPSDNVPRYSSINRKPTQNVSQV